MMCRSLVQALLAMSLVAVAGCTNHPDGYRDTRAPIGATTRFDAEQFSGQWIIAASFTQRRKKPVAFTQVQEGARLQLTTDEIPRIAGFYSEGVPGELIPLNAGNETLVVLWVDDDFRTAAIGTISGSLGLVLDREGDIPEDRALCETFLIFTAGTRAN